MNFGSFGKPFFLTLGWLSFLLGVIGVFLPVLPTTPFMILSAWAFSKSSVRMHQWLITRPMIGPMIVQWNEFGVIKLRAKITASSLMLICMSFPLFIIHLTIWIRMTIAVIAFCVLVFIWTRPSSESKN